MLPTAASCARKFSDKFVVSHYQDKINLLRDATVRALDGLPLAVFHFKDKLDARFSNIYGQNKKEQ